MRDALIRWLVNRAYTSDNILLITGDLGYWSLILIDVHTNQFNAGVAEQNMAGLAAGLSLEGFRPYIYSIGIFPTFRCAEQQEMTLTIINFLLSFARLIRRCIWKSWLLASCYSRSFVNAITS